ncbi:hypothetical protein Tco_0748699 [Tanacetum coccineum]|uniref:Uncharacterized protein n=1 Tax=Tanacetum coccineum TaxID=301880 RepID=A0ABQ4YZC0_9ASTR
MDSLWVGGSRDVGGGPGVEPRRGGMRCTLGDVVCDEEGRSKWLEVAVAPAVGCNDWRDAAKSGSWDSGRCRCGCGKEIGRQEGRRGIGYDAGRWEWGLVGMVSRGRWESDLVAVGYLIRRDRRDVRHSVEMGAVSAEEIGRVVWVLRSCGLMIRRNTREEGRESECNEIMQVRNCVNSTPEFCVCVENGVVRGVGPREGCGSAWWRGRRDGRLWGRARTVYESERWSKGSWLREASCARGGMCGVSRTRRRQFFMVCDSECAVGEFCRVIGEALGSELGHERTNRWDGRGSCKG